MKKLLIALILVFVLLPVGGLVFLKLGWSALFAPKIRASIVDASQQWGYQTKIGDITLKSWLLPVKIQVSGIEVSDSEKSLNAKVPSLILQLHPTALTTDLSKLTGLVEVTLNQPQISLVQKSSADESASDTTGAPQSKNSQNSAFAVPPVGLVFKINEGQVVIDQQTPAGTNRLSLLETTGELKLPPLTMAKVGELNIKGKLQYNMVSTPFPIQGRAPFSLQSDSLAVSQQGVTVRSLVASLGGLQTTIEGKIQKASQRWQVKAQVKDLADLQKGGLLPEGRWQGGLDASIDFKGVTGQPPKVSGVIQFNKVAGRLLDPIKQQGSELSGGFAIQGEVDFEHQGQLKKLKSKLAANLTSLHLLKPDLFEKKAGVPLTVSIGSFLKGKRIILSQLKIRLAQVSSLIKGELATTAGGRSQLQIQIDKTDLKGLESILLPMKKYPVTGSLGLKAQVSGDLSQPDQWQIFANPIQLQLVSGLNMQDKEKGYIIQGPFSANLSGVLQVARQEIQKAQLTGRLNLDGMAFKMQNGLEKTPQQKLNLVFSGGKSSNLFRFKQFLIQTFFGSFDITGSLSNPLKPKLDLSMKISSLRLESLQEVVKSFKDLPIQGLVNGSAQLRGTFDPKLGIEKSPLQVSGKMLHNASLLSWTSRKAEHQPLPDKTKTPGSNKNAIQPLLPDWPVLKSAQLALVSKIKKVIFNDLTVTDFVLDGQFNKGVLTGRVSMQRLFSGNLTLEKMKTDLYKVPTYVEGEVVTQGLDLKQAVTWGMPEQKDLIKGHMDGGLSLRMPFPSHADVMQNSVSSGTVKIEGFEVSTLKLDQMINDLLGKIPGMKNKKQVRTKNVKALFKSKFSFKGGTLAYRDTSFLTPENHLLQANGTLQQDKTLALTGKVLVSGVKVKDRLQSCLLDAQGRLEVPLQYSGSIIQPKLSNAAKVIEKIGGRYLECEKRSQIEKAKGEVKKEADKFLKKEGKKLEEKLKDKLKNIF